MAGRIELDPQLMAGAAAISFVLTGSIALIWWWCGWSCPCSWCCKIGSRRQDRYKDDGDSDPEDDEETGKPLGKTADEFIAEWEAKFRKSLKSPAESSRSSPVPILSVSGPPPNAARIVDQRRASANADRIVAMAQTKLAQSGQRATAAASSRARRLSNLDADAEKVIWTGHGIHTQRKTVAELRDIAREEQQERMSYLTGSINGDRKPKKPKERRRSKPRLSEELAFADQERRRSKPRLSEELPFDAFAGHERRGAAPYYSEDLQPRRRAASLQHPSEAPRSRAPTSSRAASARASREVLSSYDLTPSDLKLLMPDSTASEPMSPQPLTGPTPAKPKRRTSRKADSSSRRRDMSDPLLMPETLPRSAPPRPRRPSASLEVPQASRRRSSNSTREEALRRAPRLSDASREAPRRPKRSVAPGNRGRSTSPRPADEFGMMPPSFSTMPSKTSTRRTGNPEWPGMMNF